MGQKTIIDNRKARHEYEFLERFEAGIELKGTEVKSLRAGKASLAEAYARIEQGEVWLYSMHISPYDFGNINNHDEKRPRRLLLHKSEIARLYAAVREKGLTLVPVRLYFSQALVKVELALARGKKLYDKRTSMAERDSKRQIERALKERGREF